MKNYPRLSYFIRNNYFNTKIMIQIALKMLVEMHSKEIFRKFLNGIVCGIAKWQQAIVNVWNRNSVLPL